jgi:hypothetical protein
MVYRSELMKTAIRLLPGLLWCLPTLALAQEAAPAAGEAPPAAEPAPAEEGPAATEKTAGEMESAAEQAKMKTEKQEAPASKPAEKPVEPKPEDHEAGEDDAYGHMMQFGIRTGIVLGYKIDFRYPESPLCRPYDGNKEPNDQQKICGFGAPPGVDVAISFAPLDGIEPFIFGRFGFSGESQTNTEPLRLFGVGARLYTMSDSRFKIFVEPAIAYETEGWAGNPEWTAAAHEGLKAEWKKDVVFHVGVGPQYDFAKAFGLFANVGIDVGVLRSISSTLMGEVGFQLRVP